MTKMRNVRDAMSLVMYTERAEGIPQAINKVIKHSRISNGNEFHFVTGEARV